MRLGPSSGIALFLLTIASVASAEPARAPTLSVGGGIAAYDRVEAGFAGHPTGGGYLATTLAWDGAPPETPTSSRAVFRGELVPELTLARLVDRGIALVGVRLELDFAQRTGGSSGSAARGNVWAAPRLGLISGADRMIAGVDLGVSAWREHSSWSFGLWWGALTWLERTDPMPAAAPIEARRSAEPLDRERLFALTFGVTLGRGY